MMAPIGKPPGFVLRDPYCIGFVEIVGTRVATNALKGLTSEQAVAAFEDALKRIAPVYASETTEQLPFLQSANSRSSEAYFQGKKDGETFTKYKLLNLASQADGEAALERFYDRVRHILSPPRQQEPQQTSFQPPGGGKGFPSPEVRRGSSEIERAEDQSPLNPPASNLTEESPATKHIGLGLLWFVGGLAVTFLTYAAASSRGGGMYLVASGAIVFGFLQLLYGLFLYVVAQNWPQNSEVQGRIAGHTQHARNATSMGGPSDQGATDVNAANPKIPEGMIKLHSPPIGEDGAPAWTDEIESATERFGREFLVPVVYEVAPGQCLGVIVARAVYQTPVRVYEGRATLIKTKDDEFRAIIVVTAPSVPDEQAGGNPWDAYETKYSELISNDLVGDTVQIIHLVCEESHSKELQRRT
jgi:hypothetical protein